MLCLNWYSEKWVRIDQMKGLGKSGGDVFLFCFVFLDFLKIAYF